MSPIYVRPAREQSEHDRLIRHLQGKYKKKFEVAVNIDGVEPATFVKIGPATLSPDLVLTEGKKLVGLVEVETGESINNLEAMAQWVHFAHARVPFHLYVPVHGYEPARRLCDSYQARVGEIWTYRPTHDGFDLIRMHNDPNATNPVRGVKAVPVSIFIPAPKPVVPEVVEPPRPVPAKAVVPAKPAAPAKPGAPVKAPPVTPAAKVPAKPEAKSTAKPEVKGAAKPATKPVAAAPAKPAKPEPKAVKPEPKAAKAPPKPAKVTKPVAKAKPAKGAKPAKAKAAPKPAAKARKPVAARGKKAAPRKR